MEMKNLKPFNEDTYMYGPNSILESPLFIEATKDTIDGELSRLGIKGGHLLMPPIVGVSKDCRMWEMFMHTKNGKKGWMVHDTGRKIKPEFLKKYFVDPIKEDGNVDLGEIPGMGDSDRFPSGDTVGMKDKTLDGAAGADRYLPTGYIEDPDKRKARKRKKNVRGFVDWIDANAKDGEEK